MTGSADRIQQLLKDKESLKKEVDRLQKNVGKLLQMMRVHDAEMVHLIDQLPISPAERHIKRQTWRKSYEERMAELV